MSSLHELRNVQLDSGTMTRSFLQALAVLPKLLHRVRLPRLTKLDLLVCHPTLALTWPTVT